MKWIAGFLAVRCIVWLDAFVRQSSIEWIIQKDHRPVFIESESDFR
jgi:hypothetical protein